MVFTTCSSASWLTVNLQFITSLLEVSDQNQQRRLIWIYCDSSLLKFMSSWTGFRLSWWCRKAFELWKISCKISLDIYISSWMITFNGMVWWSRAMETFGASAQLELSSKFKWKLSQRIISRVVRQLDNSRKASRYYTTIDRGRDCKSNLI